MRNFRNYEVWKEGISLVTEIYRLTDRFPKEEVFGLTSQIRKSVISIPSNIAEGSSRDSQRDFRRFVEIALGSAFELETQLYIADNLRFINDISVFEEILKALDALQAKLNALRNTLK